MYINFESISVKKYERDGKLPLVIADDVAMNDNCDIFIVDDKLEIQRKDDHVSAFIVCKEFAPVPCIQSNITVILLDNDKMLVELNSGALHIKDENGMIGLVSIDTVDDNKMAMYTPETLIYVDEKLNPMILPYHAPEEYADHEAWFNNEYNNEKNLLEWRTVAKMRNTLECFCDNELKYPYEFAFDLEVYWNYHKGADIKKVSLSIKLLSASDISNGFIANIANIKSHINAKKNLSELYSSNSILGGSAEFDDYGDDEEDDEYFDNFFNEGKYNEDEDDYE